MSSGTSEYISDTINERMHSYGTLHKLLRARVAPVISMLWLVAPLLRPPVDATIKCTDPPKVVDLFFLYWGFDK